MPVTDFQLDFRVDRPPLEAFDVISDVRGWWTGDIEGPTAAVGDVFEYRVSDIHRSTQRITDAVPGELIVWHVDDALLSFTADPREWVGTDIRFKLTPDAAGGTALRFVHRGLVPEVECYDACSGAWSHYVGESLRKRLEHEK
jgi:uncharacterized protein YndB with AHSA1/START domain